MNLRLRLNILTGLLMVLFFVIFFRLFYWQVLARESLSLIALTQQQTTLTVPAKRGEIQFSDGTALAANQPTWLAYLTRQPDQDPIGLAEKMAPMLYPEATDSAGVESLTRRFEDPNWQWLSLGKKLRQEQKTGLESLDLDNLWFEPTQSRFYPEASMAAQLLGFVGLDKDGNDLGYYGLEGYYQLELAGRPGIIRQEQDAANQPILTGEFLFQEKRNGRNLKLYLDKGLQFLVEKRLNKAIEQFGAKAGSVTVMDPNTGAILAMASLPKYDPLTYPEFEPELFTNPVVADAFEPGSIFKVLVMAAALDSRAVEPDTICDICDGPVKVDKYTINTWNEEYRPNSTMSEILINSDNVGMVFIGQKLGLNRFLDYFKAFGFGQKTGIDLQDEMVLQPKADKDWTFVDLATASFGQGFLASGMQLVTAVAAIANGGEMVKPRLVEKIIGEESTVTLFSGERRRVIQPETARQVTDMMVAAASSGEAKWVDITGYRIAGKTGTAQVAVGGKYAEEKTNASFIGFAPADKPKFVMLVTLKEPSSSPWASETAAPLWFAIAQDLFNHFNVVPNRR